MMKPFGPGPKKRRSGVGLPVGPRGVSSVLARRSPAKRSPFKRRPVAGPSSLASRSAPNDPVADGPCNIKVAVRVRPENEREMAGASRNIIEIVDSQMLIFDPKEDNDDFFYKGRKQEMRDLNKKVQRDHKFAFDCVFGPNATNADVFEATTKDLIDVIFNGFNCSVFVYGATGSGKTHTMLGKEDNPGITLRTVLELYKRIDQLDENVNCEVMISYLEIYNENVFDLINPGTLLQVREDGKAGVNITGLSRHKPSGPEDLLKLLQFGNANRTQHPTDANKESSRSHAIFQVYVKLKSRSSGLSADMKVAKLSMIDLAGSERGSATLSRGAARLREGSNINRSLLALGNCINALADGSKYIPYRDSKLTRLLKDSIGGNCRTVMISNISPSSLTFEDTYNTLKYADRAKKIKIRLKKNVVSVEHHVAQYAKIVEDLKLEILSLQNKIAALEEENQALLNQVEDSPESILVNRGVEQPSSNEEIEKLRQQLADYECRQKEYDELRAKIDAFERDRLAREASQDYHSIVMQPLDEKTSKLLNEHQTWIKENFRLQSELNLIELQREYHKRKLDRCSAVTPTDTIDESVAKKFKKIVSNLEKKQVKTRRKNRQAALHYTTSRRALESEDASKPFVWSEVNQLKTELTNEHLRKMLLMMVDEQNRTEELLTTSLAQLKKSHLLLVSYGNSSDEMSEEYQDLISRIQGTRVQYRDTHLVETNEDSTSDRIGDFFAKILDLEIGAIETTLNETEIKQNLNETVVFENRVNDVEFLPVVEPVPSLPDVDEIDVDESDIDEKEEVWRPPTPPRSAAINADQTPPSPKLSTISFPKMTSNPFSLESVDQELPLPEQTPADATFCFAASETDCSPPKMSTNNSTFCLSTEREENTPSTFLGLDKLVPTSTFVDSFPIQSSAMTSSNPKSSYAQFLDIPQELSTGLPMTSEINVDSASSVECSLANESPNPSPALDATINLNDDHSTHSANSKLDSTIIISKGNADIEARRLTFLIPTIDDSKENVKKVVAPPIAMVSPMTSQGAAGGVKAKKSLKKAFQMPFASTSNLRSMLDLKPTAQKSRDATAARSQVASSSTPTLQSSSTLTSTSSTTASSSSAPSYMQLTAASRIRARVPLANIPQRQRSRSPHDRITTPVVPESGHVVPKSNPGPSTGPPRLKKSYTTSNLHKFK